MFPAPRAGPISSLSLGFALFCLTVSATLAAAPTITSFTPSSGKLSTVVTITGTNFVSPR